MTAHPQCLPCWYRDHPDGSAPAHRVINGPVRRCAVCGVQTTDGVTVDRPQLGYLTRWILGRRQRHYAPLRFAATGPRQCPNCMCERFAFPTAEFFCPDCRDATEEVLYA